MKIIKIEAFDSGAHDNQSWTQMQIPNGWAIIPDDINIPETFPFVNIEVQDNVVISMTEGVVPEPEDTRTPAQKREEAYNTLACISWRDEEITVTKAALQWQYYTAEGNVEIAQQLTALIAEAKAQIREQIPDEN